MCRRGGGRAIGARNLRGAPLSSPDPRQLITDPAARTIAGGISVMTRTRWARDPKIRWPKPAAVIRGRAYYYLRDIHDLVDRLVELTATGEATTVAPLDPRRRQSAKKPQEAL
jgi:hypothetical protein